MLWVQRAQRGPEEGALRLSRMGSRAKRAREVFLEEATPEQNCEG